MPKTNPLLLPPELLLTPARMARQFVPGYLFPLHIQCFQREFLRLLSDPTYNRVIIECPVRHSKSFSWSQVHVAWFLLTHPGKNAMIAAHTAELSGEFLSWIRSFLRRVGPLFGRTVDPEQQSTSHIRILGNGPPSELYGTGRGGAIAGKGATLIVADDLLRNQEEAASPTVRKACNTWFAAELMTRLEPQGKVVVAMSRRHPEDVSGWLLAQNATSPPAEQWHSVKFQAINDQGAALWPQRFPIEKLNAIRQTYEDAGQGYLFSSLYQQAARGDPSTTEWPDEWLTNKLFYQELPPSLSVRMKLIACDPSKGSKSKAGDDCAIVLGLLDTKGTLWIDDLFARPSPIPDVEANLVAMILKHQPKAASCETHGFQEALALEVRRQLDLQHCLIPLHPFDAGSENKHVRIRMMLSDWLRLGRLRIRDSLAGRRLLEQCKAFPSGDHDDLVDALAQLIQVLATLLG